MNISSCILTIIKNEHLYLDEWITYHTNLGINHFFIVEDIGSESHKEITDKYDNVTLFDIENTIPEDIYKILLDNRRKNRNVAQKTVIPFMLDYLKKNANEYDWCFVIDNDEFLTLENNDTTLNEILDMFTDYDAFVMKWKLYGANGLVFKPDYKDKGVVDTFTEPAKGYLIDFKLSLIKTCYNLRTYNETFYGSIHHPHLCKSCNTKFQTDLRQQTYKKIYIRHYITRSLEEYIWKKESRGYFYRAGSSLNLFFDVNSDMRDKKEEYIQAVRDKLAKQCQQPQD